MVIFLSLFLEGDLVKDKFLFFFFFYKFDIFDGVVIEYNIFASNFSGNLFIFLITFSDPFSIFSSVDDRFEYNFSILFLTKLIKLFHHSRMPVMSHHPILDYLLQLIKVL